jgi:sugar lactone lactonase YvrE
VIAAGSSAMVQAHPGRGIVVDSSGHVYVADAVRSVVWRFAPDGSLAPAARDVHAHWLAIDADGGVLADHVRYDPGTRQFLRGLVRIDPSGSLEQQIAPRADPDGLDAGAFAVRDTVLYIARDSMPVIEGRRDGTQSRIAALPAATAPVNSLGVDPEGRLVAVRGRDLLRLAADGSVEVLTIAPGAPDETGPGLRDLWGLAFAGEDRLLTTDPGRRQVLAIDDAGRPQLVHQSPAPWFPTGVATQGKRILVLEHGLLDDRNLGPRVTILDDGKAPHVLGEVSDPAAASK